MKGKLVFWIIFAMVAVLAIGAVTWAGFYKAAKDSATTGPIQNQNRNQNQNQEEEQKTFCQKEMEQGSGNITVTSPAKEAEVTSPISVTGEANVFEATFTLRLVDCNGNEISKVVAMTTGGDIGQLNPYSESLTYGSDYAGQAAYIEAYSESAKDGSIQDLIQIPIWLK